METFIGFRPMVDDHQYADRKQECLNGVDFSELDAPIADLISEICELSFCFTLQSCFGHFLFSGHDGPTNIGPPSKADDLQDVLYRIAYIAFCIENNRSGREFLRSLKQVPEIDPDYIQFGCADWFWKRNPNSYVLQVIPWKFMLDDECTIDFQEAQSIEKARNRFYDHLRKLISNLRLV